MIASRMRLTFVLAGLGVFSAASAPSAEEIVTAGGIFKDCKEAVAYRDGKLVDAVDEQYGRYSRGVQGRVEELARELWPLRDAAQSAYEAAGEKRISAIKNAVLRTAFYGALGKAGSSVSSLKAFSSLTGKQQAIVQEVGKRAATLHAQSIEAARGKEFLTGNQTSVDGYIEENLDLFLSVVVPEGAKWAGGPAGAAIVLGAKMGIASANAYMETSLAVDDARIMRDALDEALTTTIVKSPKESLARLYMTKAVIDERCGDIEGRDRSSNKDDVRKAVEEYDKKEADELDAILKELEAKNRRLKELQRKSRPSARNKPGRRSRSSSRGRRRDPRCGAAYRQLQACRNHPYGAPCVRATQSWINANC